MYIMFAASMSIYLAQVLWENTHLILVQYREWVMWYILVTSLISFIICYRFGPVTNNRTKQIIQWFLQVCCCNISFLSLFIDIIFEFINLLI